MILVLVLACGFCLAGCLGQPSSSFIKAGDVEGHPGTMTQPADADSMAGGPPQNSGYADDTRRAAGPGEAENQISIEQILSFTRALDENLRTGSEVRTPYNTEGRSTAPDSQRSEYDGVARHYSAVPPEHELFASINILMSELERDQKLSTVTLEAMMKKLGETSSGRKEILKSILSDLARLGTWRGADQNYFSALEKQESGNQNIDTESIPKDSDIDTNDQYLPDASTERNRFRPDSSYVVRSEIDAEGAEAGDRSEGLAVNDAAQMDNLDFTREEDYPGGRKGRLNDLLHRNMLQLEQMLKELKSNNTRASNRLSGSLPDDDQPGENDDEDPSAGVDSEVGPEDRDEFLPYSIAPAAAGIGGKVMPDSGSADGEFQKTLSAYLDAPYLKRLRRDAEDYKLKFRQKMRARLSITYGHVVPCKYQDRFYCMNGGTCVFVDALTLKTCRCPVGYIGHRCMLIDQEYIFSLINQLISS